MHTAFDPSHITWLYLPTAILLGALHGLEPGHSKTMMAAFIIAIRGTIAQAILLGLSAAISHSLLIWLLAALALHFGSQWNAESVEPYLQIGSAIAIAALALWMFLRTRSEVRAAHEHLHHHHHGHSHDEHDGHGHQHHHDHDHDHHHDDHHHDHQHDHDHGHEHHHHSHEPAIMEEFQDAHERAHAEDIERRFAGRTVTTLQIILFGVTGGLMPCPAAFSVLLICLRLKKMTLGFFMVGAFSFGLAITMVTTGMLAAWSARHAERKFRGFGELMRRAPYLSCIVMVAIAIIMAWYGWQGLHGARIEG